MDTGRYIVVEGPIGVGKTALAEKLAESLGSRLITEDRRANPFMEGFLENPEHYAFQHQVFLLLSRFRQLKELNQLDLFSRGTVGDFLLDRDRLYARINLKDDEFILYGQIYNLLSDRAPRPDLVIYLSAKSEILWKKIRSNKEHGISFDFLRDLVEAYNRFFFHFELCPLLVVNVSDVDFLEDEDGFRHLLKEINLHRKGVKHYVPLGKRSSLL